MTKFSVGKTYSKIEEAVFATPPNPIIINIIQNLDKFVKDKLQFVYSVLYIALFFSSAKNSLFIIKQRLPKKLPIKEPTCYYINLRYIGRIIGLMINL